MWPGSMRVGPVAFTAYDLMRLLAILGAVGLAVALNRRQGIEARVTLGIAACCIPASILASWLLDAVEYAPTLSAVGSELARNGSSIFGGLFASLTMVWLLASRLGIAPLRFLDAGAPAIALGEAVTRLGCFCAGCCYGVPWNGPWAVTFPRGSFAVGDQGARGLIGPLALRSLPVHPVQLYGAAIMLAVTWALVRRFGRPHRDGEVLCWLLVAYGAYRLGIAPFRTEALASMKVFAATFVVVGAGGLWWRRAPPAPAGSVAATAR